MPLGAVLSEVSNGVVVSNAAHVILSEVSNANEGGTGSAFAKRSLTS